MLRHIREIVEATKELTSDCKDEWQRNTLPAIKRRLPQAQPPTQEEIDVELEEARKVAPIFKDCTRYIKIEDDRANRPTRKTTMKVEEYNYALKLYHALKQEYGEDVPRPEDFPYGMDDSSWVEALEKFKAENEG